MEQRYTKRGSIKGLNDMKNISSTEPNKRQVRYHTFSGPEGTKVKALMEIFERQPTSEPLNATTSTNNQVELNQPLTSDTPSNAVTNPTEITIQTETVQQPTLTTDSSQTAVESEFVDDTPQSEKKIGLDESSDSSTVTSTSDSKELQPSDIQNEVVLEPEEERTSDKGEEEVPERTAQVVEERTETGPSPPLDAPVESISNSSMSQDSMVGVTTSSSELRSLKESSETSEEPPFRKLATSESAKEKYQKELIEMKYENDKRLEQQQLEQAYSNKKEPEMVQGQKDSLRRTRSEGKEGTKTLREFIRKRSEKDLSIKSVEAVSMDTKLRSNTVTVSPRTDFLGADNKDLITQCSYAFARGEKKQVKKKILKMLGKQSTRTALFTAVDQYGKFHVSLYASNCACRAEYPPSLCGQLPRINQTPCGKKDGYK